ncbi:alpha/beta fold hydrolase [Rhodobacterales bacterium HKCCE2091]|nr:alpha/beta fold hydrolase [Rhodobacterales bacterium HKCCE2091]
MTDPAPGPEPAPFFSEVAEGPPGVRAYWLRTSDDARIRFAYWAPDAPRGTILMFPGRTEYVEKYGRLAGDFGAAGYAMSAVDWRGQGLADRPPFRYDIGHVESFDLFREDVAALRAGLAAVGAPQPWFLIGHSMGGAIGLRALHDGLPVRRAVFTAPMWGIAMSPLGRIMARVLKAVAKPLGLERRFTPSTGPAAPMDFDDNRLTTDRDQFDYMERQTATHPELALGGPSIRWFSEALAETAELMEMDAPPVDCVTFLGTEEAIVAAAAVKKRMAHWPGGELRVVSGARHEVLMEAPAMRDRVITEILEFFDRD